MKVAIVILNFNGRKHLEQFLPSVVDHCPDFASVIVADNGSSDDSISWLRENYPKVQIIDLHFNYGFAGGYNRALSQVEATYYAILNSDVEVTPDWVDMLTRHMDKSPEIAACQPKVKDYKQKNFFEYAGASGGFIDRDGYPFCRGRFFDFCERDIGQHNDIREVFWATGACLFIRSEAFHEVGGFDEDLFAHMEEIDLCWRLKNRGHQIFCFPETTVYHLGGGTLSVQNPRKTYLNFRNNLTVIFKNDYEGSIWKKIIRRMLLDGIAAFAMIFKRGPSHFAAVIRAHLYFWRNLKKTKSKRKVLRALSGNVNRTGRYKGSLVVDYFIRQKKAFSALPAYSIYRQSRKS